MVLRILRANTEDDRRVAGRSGGGLHGLLVVMIDELENATD